MHTNNENYKSVTKYHSTIPR